MKAIEKYYSRISDILTGVFREERDAMEKAAVALSEANKHSHSIFAFGCNHAGLITQELFYRTGGMVTINLVRAPGMMLDVSPITMSSELERIPGYGKIIFDSLKTREKDVMIIHSVSGRNAVTVDMAAAASKKGLTVIVITNMNTASMVTSRHPSGRKLHDFADILLDDHGDLGDAAVCLDGFGQKIAATSTVIGAAMLNAIVARACELLWEQGICPPVFMSGNIDGGDAYNREIIASHRENIFYM